MSLPILTALVAFGITAGVLAVHLTGGSKRSSISGEADARRLFAADFPNERTGRAWLTSDAQSAFLELSEGRLGIVQGFGDGFFTRIVSRKDIAALSLRDPAIVSIRFRDFTWTGGHFHFAARPDAETIMAAIGGAVHAGAGG